MNQLPNIKLNPEDIEKFKYFLQLLPSSSSKSVITLRVFSDEILSFTENNRSKNYYSSVKLSLKHLTEHFGAQSPINDITIKHAEEFIGKLKKKVGEGHRVYYRTLKALFNKAIEWNYISENPFNKIKLSKKQRLAPVFIDTTALQTITSKITNSTIIDIIRMGFYSGMRLNELVNLKWRNINLDDRVVTVGDNDFITKGRQQRFIPISNELFDLLQLRKEMYADLCGRDNYVFIKTNGSRYTGDYVSKKFKAACRNCSLNEKVHFHSLRHSFASLLAQKGVSLYIIKELLGHSSISTTEIYSHLNKESLKAAIKLFDNI